MINFKKIYCVFLCFLLFACSNQEIATSESKILGVVYYCKRITVCDAYGNMQGFYTANMQGLENTSISYNEANFNFIFDNGETKKEFSGTLEEFENTDKDTYTANGKTSEGDDIVLIYKVENKVVTDVLYTMKDEDLNFISFLFTTEKFERDQSATINFILSEDGKIKNTNINEKVDFENTSTFETIKENFKTIFGDKALKCGVSDGYLIFVVGTDSGTTSAILEKESSFTESWSKLCENADLVSEKYKEAIDTIGYKELSVGVFLVSDLDSSVSLYVSQDGDCLYNAISDNNFNGIEKVEQVEEDNNNNYEESHQEEIVSIPFTNKYGTSTTKCHHNDCNNYIARSGDTWDCEKHANNCLNCGKYIDCDAMYCMDCLSSYSSN